MSSFTVPTVKIGETVTSAIGYGAMGLGGAFYGKADSDEERFKVLDHLYNLGERHIDTANVYGDSEILLGKWFARNPSYRSTIFLATKFGFDTANGWSIRADPAFVHSEFEDSIKKLGVEVVDLYYLHRPDAKVPIEITVGAMAELVKAGRVKYLGLSECSPDTIRRAHKVHPIAAVQVEYSPFELYMEKPGGVFDTCKELGIKIIAYSPNARGLLTGRFKSPEDFPADDQRRNFPKFSAANFPRTLKLISLLESIAASHSIPSPTQQKATENQKDTKATPAQVSIAWVLAQGAYPIPGSKQLAYVEENFLSSRLTLSAEELARIREVAEEIERANVDEGKGRYPGAFEAQLGVETLALEKWSGKRE